MILSSLNRQLYQINFNIPNSILDKDPTVSNGIILGNSLSDWENRLRSNPAAQANAIQDYTTRVINKVLPTGFNYNPQTGEIQDANEWVKAIQTCYANQYIIDEYWRRGQAVPLVVVKAGFDETSIDSLGILTSIVQERIGRFWSQSTVLQQESGQVFFTYSNFLMFILATAVGNPRDWWVFGINSLQINNGDPAHISSWINPELGKTWAIHADSQLSYVNLIELGARVQLFEDLTVVDPNTFSILDWDHMIKGSYLGTKRSDLMFKLGQYLLSFDIKTRQVLPMNMVT